MQLSEVVSARRKEETELDRHKELTARLTTAIDKQLELTRLLKKLALATQKLETIKIITLLQSNIEFAKLRPLDLRVTFLLRSNQSEFRVYGVYPTLKSSGHPGDLGFLQLEGPVQRVKTALGSQFFRDRLDWTNGPSFWIRIYKQHAIEALEKSRDGVFSYWPYENIGDFRDAYPVVECSGNLCDKVESVQVLLNDTYTAAMPRASFGRLAQHDLLNLIEIAQDTR